MPTAFNKPDGFIPVIVAATNGFTARQVHVWQPFAREPDFGATSATYRLAELVARAEVSA